MKAKIKKKVPKCNREIVETKSKLLYITAHSPGLVQPLR